MYGCGIGRWERRGNVLQLSCSGAVVATWSHPSHVWEMARGLMSLKKCCLHLLNFSLDKWVGELLGPAQNSTLTVTMCCFCLCKAQASLVGEKREGHQLATATVTGLQLCKLWAYLINQLTKAKIRQRLQTSGGAAELIQLPRWQPLLCSRAHYRKNIFVLLRIDLAYLIPLKHSPCLSPLLWYLDQN